VEGCGEGGVIFCDLPSIPSGPVGKFMVTQMAAVAELEVALISQRTRAALAAAKAKGTTLGGWRGGPKVDPARGRAALSEAADAFAERVGPIVTEMREAGASRREIARSLTEKGIKTARGGQWSATAVRAVLGRAEVDTPAP